MCLLLDNEKTNPEIHPSLFTSEKQEELPSRYNNATEVAFLVARRGVNVFSSATGSSIRIEDAAFSAFGDEYLMTVRTSGIGFVEILARWNDLEGDLHMRALFSDPVIMQDQAISRLVTLPENAQNIRLTAGLRTPEGCREGEERFTLSVESLTLESIDRSAATPSTIP